jgi:hypothetical protein
MQSKTLFLLSTLFLFSSFLTVDISAQNTTTTTPASQQEIKAPAPQPMPAAQGEKPKVEAAKPTIQIDKTSINNGGTITVTGTAPAGSKVYIELWNEEKKVRANVFDNKKNKEGVIPYILYLSQDMPSYYKIIVPKEYKDNLAKAKANKKWKYSEVLKEIGADAAYSVPSKIKIDAYKASIMAAVIGSRGELLPALDDKENKKRSMQLVKARFRSVGNLLGADVVSNPDGTFKAELKIRDSIAPGKYNVTAVAVTERKKEGDKEIVKKVKSDTASFTNEIGFPNLYMANAGTSLNIIIPFFLALGVVIFGVLMGAGGGFILNPLLVTFFPLPHTIVAGTVMPTVLFAQATGIMNYSKIKFINWKLGIGIGIAMLVGGFIGPKLTELITLDEFKFLFGWVLFILAGLMFWQTTPSYLDKNKKEQAILKEFKKRAEETAKKKG